MTADTTEELVQNIVRDLHAGSPAARRLAAGALAVIADHPAVLPALLDGLKDDDVSVRLAVARALKHLGDRALPKLEKALGDPSLDFRRTVILALGMMGWSARRAVPRLLKLRDDPELGPEATQALASIQRRWRPDGKKLLVALYPALLCCGVLLGIAHEGVAWLSLFGQVEGVVLAVTVAWAILGAYFGVYVGIALAGRMGITMGAHLLGMAGACAGAIVGRLVGTAVEPVIRALTL